MRARQSHSRNTYSHFHFLMQGIASSGFALLAMTFGFTVIASEFTSAAIPFTEHYSFNPPATALFIMVSRMQINSISTGSIATTIAA